MATDRRSSEMDRSRSTVSSLKALSTDRRGFPRQESTMLRQKKETRKNGGGYAKKDSPDQLEDLWLFPLSLLHSLLHGCDDAVCLILGTVLRTLLGRPCGNETKRSMRILLCIVQWIQGDVFFLILFRNGEYFLPG